MSLQIALEKSLSQFDFLMSSPYERYDLTNMVKQKDRFAVRQGDLIITNYEIDGRRKRGLRYAWLDKYKGKNGDANSNILVFAGNHFVIPLKNETVVAHPEHGIVVIPLNKENLNFYTFRNAVD